MFDGMSGGVRGFEATARGIPPVYYDGVSYVILITVLIFYKPTKFCDYFSLPPILGLI